jgi:5S rRNA maturation endonuclease (ribonuclease M5)
MITPQQILALSKKLSERVPELLDLFDVNYTLNSDIYSFPCPVHGGDNPTGCSIFTDEKPNWSCWTHSCQDEFKKTLFGFVRGVLSFRAGYTVSMNEAAKFCTKFLKCELDDIPQVQENLGIKRQVKLLEVFDKKPVREKTKIDRRVVTSSLDIPSKYYLKRNYSAEVLTEFDIGDCHRPGKTMNGRAVVPVYDENNNYVGCTGRRINDEMEKKWLNSYGFRKAQYLYGLNIAKDFIIKTGTVILVEGQGDVWRAHEAGFKNTVSIMGADFSDEQLILLECSGCLNVLILTDMDEAGEKAANKIIEKCGRRFNCNRIELPTHDIGDMSVEEVKLFLENL